MKKYSKYSTVSWLCALAIDFSYKNGQESREVSNSTADAILTHSARSNAQGCYTQLRTCWLTAAVQVPTYVYSVLLVVDWSGSYSPPSAGVFTVRESFC